MNRKNPVRALLRCMMLILLFVPVVLTAQSSSSEDKVWVIPIKGDIAPSTSTFVRREARSALANGATVLIFEIDTFGGRVDSALQITSFIMSIRNAKTVAWVSVGEDSMGVSWSAGALIAFACEEIFMAPGTSMGAAAPVIAGAEGMTAAGEKTVAAVRSQMAAIAERNGHPVGLGLAMVDFDVELWEVTVEGQTQALTLTELERLERSVQRGSPRIERIDIISPQGKLLSLSAGEALRFGLIASLVDSREDLLAAIGVQGVVTETSPSSADAIISFLTSGAVQGILILVGLVLIFLELQTPGFGIPGIAGVLAFVIVFGSSAMLGRVDSLEIILFLAGLALLAVEIFILPGFGIVGISGIILIGLSLVLSMQDFVIPSIDWEWQLFGRNALMVFASLVGAVFTIVIIALAGPKLKMFDRLTLKTSISGTAGGPDPDSPAFSGTAASISERALEDEESFASLAGKTGTSDSVLRPSGRALIDGRVYTVEADGDFIEEGTRIEVTRVRGNRIIVRRV